MRKKIIKAFKLSSSGKNNLHWRLLIPKEFWESMELNEGDNVELSLNDNKTLEIRKVEVK
ncbi:hypothetical protein [Fusobacterium sp. SYSU M8D902]|uniref:AbrB/MazE/SpoVT family DNA-binding domain-containing protein n=1 Tax=Fusobacterium sp. SYSU M8D902 TaxID=3159562 RepID=UPI0032E4C5DA